MSNCPHCEKPILITEFLDKTDDVVDVHKWCVDEFIAKSSLIQFEVCFEYAKNNKGFVFLSGRIHEYIRMATFGMLSGVAM